MSEEIAIVGLACRFPGAADTGRFWRKLRTGYDGIRRDPAAKADAGGGDHVAAYGVLPESGVFDWRFFGYSRADAAAIDPQQRVFLQTASLALDDAGIDPCRFGAPIGVFAGCDPPQVTPGAPETAWDKDMLTARAAYKLGLTGPAVTVQSACSTSLLAVHLACASLRDGECDLALAGGVRLGGPGEDGYHYVEGGILSPDGYCRPFDARAAGTVPGEGVGVVVLRRLAEALRDRHRIVAVVRGSAANNDGSDKVGFTAPSVSGQREVILRALDRAAADAADIGYVEAHGTGTPLGDPIEVAALTEAFRRHTGRTGFCGLGSVKGNIGHTGSAAGVAGLIKAALVLKHGELVPNAHFERPNPRLGLDDGPFRVVTDLRGLPPSALAGVSALGMGGTNVHVVLGPPPAVPSTVAEAGPRVLCLSARSGDSLARYAQALAERLGEPDPPSLAETAWTLDHGRRAHPLRRAVVAETAEAARSELARETTPVRAAEHARAVLLFPGQGGRHGGGDHARERLPVARRAFQRAREVLPGRLGLDPGLLTGGDPGDTLVQQVSLFVLGYGLAGQLLDWGLRPVAALGSSLGEYTAAAVAGLWSFDDALELVARRAIAMRACPPGRMLAADLDAGSARERAGGMVTVAIEDTGRTVLSGPADEIEGLAARWTSEGVRCRMLNTRLAFHSPAMRGAADALARAVAEIPAGRLAFPVMSNVTGAPLSEEDAADPAYWAEQLCGPVHLGRCAEAVLGGPGDLFAELGPGTALLGTLRRHPSWTAERAGAALPGREEDDELGLLRGLAALWERGAPVGWDDLDPGPPAARCALPGPPFDPLPLDAPPPSVDEPDGDLERLWKEALGVDAVSADDDFYRLGGDSLALLRLTTSVRDRLGAVVPVAALAERPTFGHLRDLARPAAAQGGGRGAPALLSQGSRPVPLYFVPPASGSSLAYRALAEALPDRTAYGFDTPGTDHPGTVAGLAAGHAGALRAARPVLLGWSMGATVAHEMAVRLGEDGVDVPLAVLIDGHPPPVPGLPAAAHPRYLADIVLQLRALRAAESGAAPDGPVAELLGSVADRAGIAGVYRRNLHALLRYASRPAPCRAVVLRAGATPARCRRLARRLAPLYPRGVDVLPVPGDHWSLLSPRGAAEIARRIEDILTALEEESEVETS
ncbi:type I polyketide synthase [Spongiactinospora sp. 9N601]|uniref:type I polyketide synthase n=1 Tax=Spongiactinospora sp. 9N601 TaxID=3375149 RepID=UPI0037B5ECA0